MQTPMSTVKPEVRKFMENENRANAVVLIPAFEPPGSLPGYVKVLRESGFNEIIVVNDGSGIAYEGIFEEIRELGAVVLAHPENRGKGAAMRTGLTEYLRLYGGRRDGVITVNSDGLDRIEDIREVAEMLAEDRAAGVAKLILGARDLASPYLTKGSRRGNKFTSFLFKYLFGIRVTDPMAGLRGIPDARVTRCLSLLERSYAYDISLLMSFKKDGYREITVPLGPRNPDAQVHYKPVYNTFLVYVVIFRKLMMCGAISIMASVVDLILFWVLTTFVLEKTAFPIIEATVLARIVSATINYTLSRNIVFKSNESRRKSLPQFALLTAIQCGISALSVHFLEMLLDGAAVPIKVVIDTALFFAAYKIQDVFIFKVKEEP